MLLKRISCTAQFDLFPYTNGVIVKINSINLDNTI